MQELSIRRSCRAGQATGSKSRRISKALLQLGRLSGRPRGVAAPAEDSTDSRLANAVGQPTRLAANSDRLAGKARLGEMDADDLRLMSAIVGKRSTSTLARFACKTAACPLLRNVP